MGPFNSDSAAATAGLNVSTCHHLISTLYNWGYVSRGANSRSYVLGSRILHLSAACLRQVDLPRRAQSFLDRLNDQTKESVQLAIMQDTNLIHILRRESRHAVRVDAGLGGNAGAAHATATGKAILAWLPPNELDRIVADKGLTAFTPHTITDIEALKEQGRAIRYAVPVDRTNGQVISANLNWSTQIIGSTPEYIRIRDWAVEKTRTRSSGISSSWPSTAAMPRSRACWPR